MQTAPLSADMLRKIDAYWRVLDTTVGWSPQERSQLRSSFFYNELVPRRTAMPPRTAGTVHRKPLFPSFGITTVTCTATRTNRKAGA